MRCRSFPVIAACFGVGLYLLGPGSLRGQQPPSSPAPSPSPPPPPSSSPPKAAPSPAPPAPTVPAPPPPAADVPRTVLEGLNPDEINEAVKLLRSYYVNPGDTDDRALARATVAGLLARLDHGVSLLPAPLKAGATPSPNAPPPREELPGELRTETFPNRIGYLRLGARNRDRLADVDKALRGFAATGVPTVVLDLRATPAGGGGDSFEWAAEVLRRLVPKGRPMFTLRRPAPAAGGGAPDRLFTANADPLYHGRLIVVADADTAGAAEAVAAVLRAERGALVVGGPTAGQAVEFADFGLGGENSPILRLAVAQVLLPPKDAPLYPGGVKPDLPVGQGRAAKLELFRQSVANGATGSMAPFILDAERPHFNEAALVARENPELDAAKEAQARRREGQPPPRLPPRDAPLQRAVDLALAADALEPRPPSR